MLHFVSASPYQSSALEECRAIAQTGDVVVLLADGVYAALTAETDFAGLRVFALKDHTAARGIAMPKWITCIDYDQLVLLTCEHHPSQTWS